MKSNAFLIISRSVLLRMRNVPDKRFKEYQDTYFMFNNFFFSSKIAPFLRYAKKYSTTGQDADADISPQMRTGCWVSRATNTLSEYEYVFIVALPQ